MITVTLYRRNQCPECDQAQADLSVLQATIPHQLAVVNIERDQGLQEKIGQNLPVVEVGPYHLQPPFTRQDLQILLSAAKDRIGQMERVDEAAYRDRLEKGHTISTGDKITNFISHHYLAVANLFLFVYILLPFLAPVFMKTNHPVLGSAIYKMFSPLCHQLPFRSWFLFGPQAFYPRELAGIDGIISYETITDSHGHEVDLLVAKNFNGNEQVGFKVALCERCVAIYGFMLLFGLAFWATRRRLRSIPMVVWMILALVPIGLDGVSQFTGIIPGLPAWLPARESTPLLRTLTGGMFGWMTAWYLFPLLEESAREARLILQRKIAVVRRLDGNENT